MSQTTVDVKKVFSSDLTLTVHWKEGERPRVDAVILSTPKIEAKDLQEVIRILSQVLAEDNSNRMLHTARPQWFTG